MFLLTTFGRSLMFTYSIYSTNNNMTLAWISFKHQRLCPKKTLQTKHIIFKNITRLQAF